jgi:hypothetical protein
MEIAGKPVIDVGIWHRRAARGAGAARQLADLVRRPDKAPFISYMKGALLHSARQRRSARTDTPAKTPTCQADHEAERARPDDIHRRQPHPLVQVGMTSIFPPTATAASVAANHSNCLSPELGPPAPALTTRRLALLGGEPDAENDQVGGASYLQGEESGSRGT